MIRLGISLLTIAALAGQSGCPAPQADQQRSRSTTASSTPARANATPAVRATAARTRSRPRASTQFLAGAHILIAYFGAMRARSNVTRNKAQALQLATQLVNQLQKDPTRFATLAKQHSDGPTAKRGGVLGSWKKGRMVPAFEAALSTLKIGAIAGPVETPFGYHVIKRLPLPPMYAGSHILISYVGATRARATVTRTRAQALAFAQKLAKKLQADPTQFAALAQKHSDGPSAARGGSLGTWKKGRMVPAFDQAIGKLKVGQVSGVVKTRFGFHVIRRDPVP